MVACTMESYEDGSLKGFSIDRFLSGQQVKVVGRRNSSASFVSSGIIERIQFPSTETSIRLNDMYKLLQEYNSSLQLYNSKLQTDLDTALVNVKCGEKEKATVVENLINLRSQFSSLQGHYTSSKASLDEVKRQKDALLTEVASLRVEFAQATKDRDQYH